MKCGCQMVVSNMAGAAEARAVSVCMLHSRLLLWAHTSCQVWHLSAFELLVVTSTSSDKP